jgi:hypothetical protein
MKQTDNNQQNGESPLAKSELTAIAEWLMGDDTGVSSQYMASVAVAGRVIKGRWFDSTPFDAPDLGRCVRLIERIPTVKKCFPVLRQASPVWDSYIANWDELTVLWHQGDYHTTTERMRKLRSLAQNNPCKSA